MIAKSDTLGIAITAPVNPGYIDSVAEYRLFQSASSTFPLPKEQSLSFCITSPDSDDAFSNNERRTTGTYAVMTDSFFSYTRREFTDAEQFLQKRSSPTYEIC